MPHGRKSSDPFEACDQQGVEFYLWVSGGLVGELNNKIYLPDDGGCGCSEGGPGAWDQDTLMSSLLLLCLCEAGRGEVGSSPKMSLWDSSHPGKSASSKVSGAVVQCYRDQKAQFQASNRMGYIPSY